MEELDNNEIKKKKIGVLKTDNLQINYLLIRELYRFACVSKNKGTMSKFYIYLLSDYQKYLIEGNQKNISKSCRDRFSKFLENGEGNMAEANKRLMDIGIPFKYFDGTLFNMNDEIRSQAEDFVFGITSEEKYKAKIGSKNFPIFQELLERDYEDITIQYEENGEKIPVIAFMADLNRKIFKLSEIKEEMNIGFCGKSKSYYYNRVTDKAEYEKNIQHEIAQNIIARKIHKNMGMKEIESLYQEIIQKGCVDSDYIENIKETKAKNIYRNGRANDVIKYNYFVIRELYKLLSGLENIDHAMERFYDFLGTSQNEYQEIIKNGIADNRYFYDKLLPFQFPVSMFRGDNPVIIKMNVNLKYKVETYFRETKALEKQIKEKRITEEKYKKKEEEYIKDFRDFLKLEICYWYHSENYILVFAVARLLEAIKEYYPIKQ